MSKGNFLIRSATRLDYNLLRYGLKRFYWPSVDALTFTTSYNSVPRIPSLLEYKWTMSQVQNGHNLIAFDENNLMNNFIGFTVNAIWSKNKTKEIQKLANETKDDRLTIISKIQNFIEEKTDIYEKFKVNEIFLINNIGVHPEYLRKSLATQMVDNSLRRAKELGYKMAVINASGEYLIRICDKVGMSRIASIKYTDIIADSDNLKLLNDTSSSTINNDDGDDDKEFFLFIRKFKV